ncbi:Alstrom syndrome protein 1 isoform X2 [Choloepus didactylus]|uniref:Alstrom syndrome protein 1 isoform X2 n=1 Tax=Choloepus didactylus TaxID=27675 RepID=UPI00189F917C|nr:Alstrom syndrome protein 1 isoform X2 [Choloepus didactylus]
MEPEDLPWPSELEEEEEEEEEEQEEEEPEKLDEDEVVMVEEVEEEFQRRESTDEEVEEEDDEARAWLQAPPIRILAPPPPPLRRRQYSEGERACSEKVVPLTAHVWQQSLCKGNNRTRISNTDVVSLETITQWCSGNDQRTESWHCLPQEMDSSETLVTSQNRLNAREEGTEVTDFPSLEEVIQDSFASPDLPLLTCLTRDQECGPDSLFHQSELHFEPLRGIPDRSEDTGWLSRPSEVNEALFQAASEVVSDLVNSCFSVSHHPLISSAEIGPWQSFLPLEQGNKEEAISSHEADELKTPKASDSYTLSSHVSWKSQEVIEQPETNLAIKDQVSFSSSSDVSTKGSDSFDASCSYVQSWKQEAVQQPGTCLTSKDQDSFSDPCDTTDKTKISQRRNSCGALYLYMPWRKQGASQHPETCLTSKDHVSFPHEVASHLNNKISNSFLPFLLERRGKGVPLTSDSHYYESVDLKAIPENEMQQKLGSLEDYKRNEDILKELSQHFEQKETRNNLVSLDTHPRSSETQHIGNVVVPDNSVKVSQPPVLSRRHDTSKMEASGGILQTVKFNLGETSEQLYFQGERSQKETSAFGAVVGAIEDVAFEAVIASIEPSERENTIKEIQTDINKSLTNASQEREPKIPELSPSNYNDEKSLFDQLSHPCYQSTPGIFEPAASKSWLHRKDVDDSSLYWHPNLKSPPAPQDMLIKPFSVIPELKLSASLTEKSHNQAVGLSKTESPLFQCDISNESFVPIGMIKSDPVVDVTEKVEFSNIYPLQVSTSDSLVLEDLKQQTPEEVADSSNYISVKHVNSDNIIEGRSAAVGSSSPANLVACDEKSQSASPSSSDASLIALLPKADVGQGEIPQGMEAKSCFTIHTNTQKDSCCVECLQGTAESDIITPDGDTECHRLDEQAVMCSERIAELLREVGGSNLGINQPFSSVLPHGPTRQPEYHSSNLRMLRLSFETVLKTLGHLSGNTFKGGTAEITQSNLKTGTTADSEDSDFGSDLSLPTKALPHLAVRPPQEKTVDQHTDDFFQQPLLDSHLNEDTLKVSAVPGTSGQKTGILKVVPPSSYRPREKLGKSILYQQGLLNSHLTEENLKVSDIPEPADQKTGIPTVPSSSSSHREEPSLFYQQELPDSHVTEEAAEVSAFPGPADQKIGTPTVTPDSYSQREKPNVFHQQEVPNDHPAEEALKSSAALGPAEQKTGIPTIPSSSYSHREKPSIFYQQELPDSHLPEVTMKSSAVSGPSDQKTGIPTIPSSSCSHREKPSIFYQQELPDSHLPEVTMKSSALSGPSDQKTGTPTIPSSSYSHREKPSIFYQQELPDSHLPEVTMKSSALSGPSDQKTGIPTIPSSSCSHREKPIMFYQQELPDSHLPEVTMKSSAVSGQSVQKTGIPTIPFSSFSHREKPNTFHQQELPDSHLTEVALKSSAVSGPANQKTEMPKGPSSSWSQREKRTSLRERVLPDSSPTEEDLKVSPIPGQTDQKTETPTISCSSSSLREMPTVLYQQLLPDSHLSEASLKSSAVPGPSDQKTGMPSRSPGSYSLREKPTIVHQQMLPGSHVAEVALKSSAVSWPSDQKTGVPTVPTGLYTHAEKLNITCQDELPNSHLSEEDIKISPAPGPADQKTRISTEPSGSYSQKEQPGVFYQQELSDIHLTEEVLKSSSVSGPADQKTETSTVPPVSSSQREKPSLFYQQVFPVNQITEVALKSLVVPRPADQKTGTLNVLPGSYTHGEIPILHQQALPDSHLTEEALKSSALPGLADQKTGTPTVPPDSYSYKEKPTLLYQQVLPEDHLTEEALKVSAVPGESDRKTRIPTVQPSSYSYRDKPTVLYQQVLPDSNLAKQDLKILDVPGPAEQKIHMPTVSPASYSLKDKPTIFYKQVSPDSHITGIILKSSALPEPTDLTSGIPAVLPDSYSHKENLDIFYQQELPDSHLTEVILKSSTAPGPTDQKTEIPTVPLGSYSDRQKPIILHQQILPDSHLPVVALRSSTPPGPADQKTGTPTLLPDFYSQREMPSILYQQALPESHLTEESLKVSAVSGPGDQKSGILLVPLNSYPLREKPDIFYQQVLTDNHLTEEALKVLSVSGAAEQKTGVPTVPSSSYSQREKPSALHQQALPDSHLSEVALKSSTVLGSADQKTGLSTVLFSSYSHRDKPSILHQQVLSDSHLTEDSLKVSAVPGPADEKSGILTISSSSYLHREKPSILHQQALPDSHLTEESLKVPAVPGSADQKTGIPSIPLGSSSHIEKPSVFSQQAFVDSHLSDEALKISTVPGPTDEKTGTPTVSCSSYSQREKPNVFYQSELPDGYLTDEDLKFSVLPVPADQNTGIPTVPPGASSHREKSSVYLKDFLDSHLTEAVLKDPAVPGLANKKPGIPILPPSTGSHKDKPIILHEQELPDNLVTEEALKISTVPGVADQNTGLLTAPSDSSSHTEKLEISAVIAPDDQKTGLPTALPHSYLHKEKAKVSFSVGPDEQKTPLLTVSSNSCPQGVRPSVSFQQKLPDRHQNEDTLKVSSVPGPTDGNTEIPVSLSSSSSDKAKSNILYAQGLPDRHLIEDALKVSVHLGPADQKTVLPKALPSSSSHRENPNIFFQPDLPDRHVAEDAHKISGVLGQADQITQAVLPTISPSIYSHSGKYKVGSERVQRLRDTLDSSETSITSNNRPLNSQADGRVVINKPVSLGFGDFSSEEPREMDSSSKTLKEIQALLMEAENIALKRCNVPAPLVPFRDVRDISHAQSKKVVCFKEPSTIAESNDDGPQKQPFLEETPSSSCIQKDINTQTNVNCQRGIENWEFISSTTVRSPLQEAESKARAALEDTLKQYEAAKYVMRSEPEGCCETIGNKIVFPMMTFIKSDSSSDTSDGNGSCSWDSNFPESLGSVSDVLLNFFPDASPNISMTDSREEDDVSESDDGGGSSVDSLAAHVKNLLQCESSLNHAKQILRDAEEEECRVRARAWNLKFNLAHDCGYSISALNEDDRRKVEEIKAKLFGHGRTTNLSKGLQSPRETGCKPEAVCSHIIIERHEKGCFRTLTAEEPQLDSHSCIFRSPEPPEMIRGQWRAQNINLSRSLDQNTSHFKVWNSLHLRSHSPFQNFTADSFKIRKGLQMPFHEKMDPWLSELVEPACVPPEEMDCHSSSQLPTPEPVTEFTTSITFSSHRHSKCISDSSVFKVGVTEGSQGTGASVGIFNSHVTEEQSTLRDLIQRTSSPSSCKMLSHSPDKDQTILAESIRQSQKLPVDFEHSHQEEKLLEISDFKVTNSEPSPSENCSSFKEIQFSDNHTLISMGRRSSTLGIKEKNVTVTPDPPPIFLEQHELFEQSKTPHADHHVRKHPSSLPQHQDCIASNVPSPIFLEQREIFEQSKTLHADHHMRKHHSPLPQGEDYMASDLPSPIFLEQRKLFEQSKAPHVDHHVRKPPFPLPQGQDCVLEKDNQHMLKSHTSNLINVEAKFNNVVSQSAPNHCTLVTSASTPPSNRKILSCVHITLSPKTPSNLDSETLDKRFHSLDPASKTRMNSEFNSDLQVISSRSLEPTSKLLTIKPIAQHQESVGFLGPKSSLDFHIVQSLLPDSNNTVNQDLKNIPSQNSQIVTSRQTQVNFSDLEEYSNPEGTPLSADRPPEEIKTPFSAFSGKLSSDAVTQITTESPEKTTFSSEIFINAEDRGHEIPGPFTQKVYRVPAKFASSSVQQIAPSHGTAQPLLLPYKPSGGTEMYYVPQLRKIPQFLDVKSDSTVESSHSGSNDAIAPDFPAQVLGTRDDNLSDMVNIKHKEGIYSKRAVTKRSWSVVKKPFQKETADATVQVAITGNENVSGAKQMEDIYNKRAVTKVGQLGEESLQKDTAGYSAAAAEELSAQVQDTEIENLPATKAIKEKEIYSKKIVPKLAWPEKNEPLLIDTAESRGHSQFENTAHSVFRSAKFYFHPPVHLPSDQDVCHESLGRGVSMRNSYVSLPYQNVDKANKDHATIESLSVSLNMGNKEAMHNTKSQTRDNPKCNRQINDPRRNCKVTSEPTTQRTTSLNELWNRYQERQRQQKSQIRDRKELTLVERLDRLAKLLQNPITHSLQASESTHDYSKGVRDVKEWTGRQQERKNKLQKKKRYKSPDKCHKNTGDLKKSKILSPHQAGRSNQINIEQIKFDKYILRKQPAFNYISNTSSDSRPSEESELLTDTATNILSTTTSPGESDVLTQTDKEVALPERSSSISTIDTARLIQAFGHERVCLSPRQIKLYSSITNQQRRCLEKRIKQSKKGHFQMTSEHTRRQNIQVEKHMISSDSVSSSASSLWSSSLTRSSKQNVHMLNKGIQAGNLEIVNGAKKHTRDVGMTFPTPSSSEARLEEDSDMNSSRSEEKNEEKRLLTFYMRDKKLRKNKPNSCEGISWFIPVENLKSGSKKENLPCGRGVYWFEPITNTKPWREPLREKNSQGQQMDSRGFLAGPGRDFDKVPPRPFVRASLQESLQFHRPDFISRSGERIKRLKLIVQERKLQNVLQSERDALFNAAREWQGYQDPVRPLRARGFPAAQKYRPVGKKEMIQRSKRIYEQLPEVQKKREEEKRKSEYKSNWLRAQLYKKKVTNRLLGRKVPWD